MWLGSSLTKEVGRRTDCVTLVGQRKGGAKGCAENKVPKRTEYYSCHSWREARTEILDELRKWEQKAETIKHKVELVEMIGVAHSQEGMMEKKLLDDKKVEIQEIQKLWSPIGRSPRSHSDRWVLNRHSWQGTELVGGRLCSQITIGEVEPMQGLFGSSEAGIKVRRTMHMAEMTAFWIPLRGLRALAAVHTDNLGNLGEGCTMERRRAVARKSNKQICGSKAWAALEKVRGKDIKFDVKHVKAHRTK